MSDRLIKTMECELIGVINGREPASVACKRILQIPEIAEGLQLREEKLVRERKMRGGMRD